MENTSHTNLLSNKFDRRAQIHTLLGEVAAARSERQSWRYQVPRIQLLAKVMGEEFKAWIESRSCSVPLPPAAFLLEPLFLFICQSNKSSVTPIKFGEKTESAFIRQMNEELQLSDAEPYLTFGIKLYRDFLRDFELSNH